MRNFGCDRLSEVLYYVALPTLASLLIFYSPWLFEGARIVKVHDNLDSDVVYNYIIGEYLVTCPGIFGPR